MTAIEERAPDLKKIAGMLNTLEATVGSFWSMDPEHRERQGYGDAMVRARAALLAEFESLTSSLRAVDAKVVEWRERAQRAEEAAYGRAATLVRQEAEREKNQGKATKARRLLSIAHEILALASVPSSTRSTEETT